MFTEKKIKLIQIALLSCVLAGCGLKGPLYQTPAEPSEKQTPADQNEEQSK